jgi:anti-sigma B factor antagonist
MRIKKTARSLLISDIPALNSRTAPALVAQARSALPPDAESIEVDLSQTDSVDSHGLGALVGFYRSLHQRRGPRVAFRLLNPAPPAQQLIELTRLHHLFEIVHDSPVPAASAVPPLS